MVSVIFFCVLPPFLENKFDTYGNRNINLTSYKKFLNGSHWDDEMLQIEYDKVTISLYDNLIGAEYKAHSGELVDWKVKHFVSFRSPERKCITIKAPFPEKILFFGPILE